MTKKDTNIQGVFADVISIDAWHEKFAPNKATVDLHADVVFGTARLGGEAESKVRFRLGIKRAELIVLIHEFEPFGVDKYSIARTGLGKKMTRSLQQVTEINASVDGSAKQEVGLKGASASFDTKVKGSAQGNLKEELKGSEDLVSIKVMHRFNNTENNNRWIFEPGLGSVLDGRPWDAVASPLLTLVDQRRSRGRTLEPSVRIEIRCLREDLVISDIEMKDEKLMEWLLNREGSRTRMKAVEAYIKMQLERYGLESGDLSDKFANVTLAQIVANNGRIG